MFEKITIIGCGLIGSSILRNIYNDKIRPHEYRTALL